MAKTRHPVVFDGSVRHVNLLCFGFVRQHLAYQNIQIDDIATIVHRKITVCKDFGFIHNECYGTVANTTQFLNFLLQGIDDNDANKNQSPNEYLQCECTCATADSVEKSEIIKCPDCTCNNITSGKYHHDIKRLNSHGLVKIQQILLFMELQFGKH